MCIDESGAFRESVVENGEITLPALIVNQMNKLKQKTQELAGELGCEPTDMEIAESMGWPVKRVHAIKTITQEVERKLRKANNG